MKWIMALLVISLFIAGCGSAPPVSDADDTPQETPDETPEELPEGVYDDETILEEENPVVQEVEIDGLTQEDLDKLGTSIKGITTDDLGGFE